MHITVKKIINFRDDLGNVYDATLAESKEEFDNNNFKDVIIKQYPQEFNKIYENEKNILKLLNHDRIVKLAHYSDEDNEIFLEKIDGKSLDDFLEENSEMNFSDRLNLVSDIASIFEYIHTLPDSKIVYGDISPSNIIIDKEGNSHLIDFGFSYDENDIPNYLDGKLFYSFGYLTPEKLKKRADQGQVSDVFAFGILTNYIMTGKNSFEKFEILKEYYDTPFEYFTMCQDNITSTHYEELDEIITSSLNYEYEKRPSMSDIKNSIDDFKTHYLY